MVDRNAEVLPGWIVKLMEGGLMPVEVDFFEELSRRVVRQEKERTAEWQPLVFSAMH